MIDLSYTNKDGLNLYEGFDNGFDYHRDGASSAQGYAHGGYPEITGETSNYTDTSYKTGDNTDFFDNGNTFDIIPSTPVVPTLVGIEVTTPPTKTKFFVRGAGVSSHYFTNETLDLTGMVVSAVYSDGSKEEITDYTTVPADGAALTTSNTQVVISYEDNEAIQPIYVGELEIYLSTYDDYEVGEDTPALLYSGYSDSELDEATANGCWILVKFENMNTNPNYDEYEPVGPDNLPGWPQTGLIYRFENETVYEDSTGATFTVPAAEGYSPLSAYTYPIFPDVPYEETVSRIIRRVISN